MNTLEQLVEQLLQSGTLLVLNPADQVSIVGPVTVTGTVTIGGQPLLVTITNDPLSVTFSDPVTVQTSKADELAFDPAPMRRLLEEMLLVLYDIRGESHRTNQRGTLAERQRWLGGKGA